MEEYNNNKDKDLDPLTETGDKPEKPLFLDEEIERIEKEKWDEAMKKAKESYEAETAFLPKEKKPGSGEGCFKG